MCFFCEKISNDLHEAATFQIDEHVRKCAAVIGDMKLLSKLSAGDMVAIEARYHTKCLVALYNQARKIETESRDERDQDKEISAIVFAELVLFIEETRQDEGTATVFKLADLTQLYQSRMEQLGVKQDVRIHSTRLKERLLSQFPDMHAYNKGRDVLLAFQDDVGAALNKAYNLDDDSDAVFLLYYYYYLARAAKIVRRHVFEES